MSSMLEQAIVDASALREAAIQSAEQAVIEKYSTEIRNTVEKLMEGNDFEESKSVEEQITEADETGEGYAFVEGTELSDLKEHELLEIDVKGLFEQLEKERLEESEDFIEIIEEDKVQQARNLSDDDEAGDDDIKVKNVSKVTIVKDDDVVTDDDNVDDKDTEVELDEAKVTATQELGEACSQDEQCKSGNCVHYSNEAGGNKCKPARDSMEEALNFDFEEVPVGQTTAFGATNAQQKEQAMLIDVMNEIEAANEKLEKKNESLTSKNNDLVRSNKKIKESVKKLAEKFEEIKLMNAKLFYTNKTLMDASLNERQKSKLVESINNAQTYEQAKIVYETLQGTVGNVSSKKQPESLSEAVGKRSSTSLLLKARKQDDKPKIDEGHIFISRMQALAGIKNLKED